MGDNKMHNRIKKLAISASAVVIVLSMLALAILSGYLNSGQYGSFFENAALVAFLLLMLLWRTLFFRTLYS